MHIQKVVNINEGGDPSQGLEVSWWENEDDDMRIEPHGVVSDVGAGHVKVTAEYGPSFFFIFKCETGKHLALVKDK